MRIAMLSTHTSPLAALGGKHSGGMNVYVRELSTELARLGHQVDIFTRAAQPEQQILEKGARLISLPAGPRRELALNELPTHLPEFAQNISDFARVEGLRYDVIHAHYWMSGLVGAQLKAAWSVPMLLMFHTLGLVKNRITAVGERESDERIRGERTAMAAADIVVAATPAERADLQWLYELRSDRVAMISPGVDLQRFVPISRAGARASLGLPLDEHLLLYVGRIEALKGIDTLIRAAHLIVSSGAPSVKSFRVQIIGGDSDEKFESLSVEMARLKNLTQELGIQDRVQFLGSRRQEELPIYYAAADLVVMPSYAETFGMVALEAMACARPVLASRVGGLAYLVQDGETGYHFQEGRPEELAQRLVELLSNSELRERMGEAARKVAEKYSWSKTAGEIIELYKTIVKLKLGSDS